MLAAHLGIATSAFAVGMLAAPTAPVASQGAAFYATYVLLTLRPAPSKVDPVDIAQGLVVAAGTGAVVHVASEEPRTLLYWTLCAHIVMSIYASAKGHLSRVRVFATIVTSVAATAMLSLCTHHATPDLSERGVIALAGAFLVSVAWRLAPTQGPNSPVVGDTLAWAAYGMVVVGFFVVREEFAPFEGGKVLLAVVPMMYASMRLQLHRATADVESASLLLAAAAVSVQHANVVERVCEPTTALAAALAAAAAVSGLRRPA